MASSTEGMLAVIPPLLVGGGLMMMTDRFINRPMRVTRRRARRFDEQEYKDLHRRQYDLYGYRYPYTGWY